jgi:hypothetical protein
MKRNSFNPTRVVLVIVLIGGLYKVGALVNPPPKGPPAELPKPNATQSAAQPAEKPMAQADMKKQMADRIKQQMQQAKMATKKAELEKKYNNGKPLSNDDGINAQYWQKVSMGSTGFKQTEEQAATKQRVTDAVNKDIAAEMAKNQANGTSAKPTIGKQLVPGGMSASPQVAPPH